MDKRATHSLSGTVDAESALPAEVQTRAEHPVIDRAGANETHDGADLARVLRAIAARIDVVLDEKVAAGAEPEARDRAARAWSSVVGRRATDATSDLRRNALATTVLRISADGWVDVDASKGGSVDEPTDEPTDDRAGEAADRRPDTAPADPRAGQEAPVLAVEAATDGGVGTEAPVATATDRSDVEARLRAARERLAARRATTAEVRVDPATPRARRVRVPVWRRAEARSVIRRLLIGLAIVGASAVVSILIT